MKRMLIVMLLWVGGCPHHDYGPPAIDPKEALVTRLAKTARNTELPVKERQKAVQELKKLGVTDWEVTDVPSGRFYLLKDDAQATGMLPTGR